eukprot:TRINITY_DN19543_c0_g1_i5.p2 TRINITY_DN19543_c0_g1~~TRINITY_DN19543_c0_g1_i5.p2  ORF type:complete len:118 (+),score=2.63 TRINITY_DN19543_c0_g1_i5:132-485(+)
MCIRDRSTTSESFKSLGLPIIIFMDFMDSEQNCHKKNIELYPTPTTMSLSKHLKQEIGPSTMQILPLNIFPVECFQHMISPFLQETKMKSKQSPCTCLLYTSPSPRDLSTSRMPSSA